MKPVSMWDDPTFLRHVIPPEEDRSHIYHLSTTIQPRWFRSPNVIPIESHERYQRKADANPA
jgi:hypothetical protein